MSNQSAVIILDELHQYLKAMIEQVESKLAEKSSSSGEDQYLDGQLDAYLHCFDMVDAYMMHLTAPLNCTTNKTSTEANR